MNNKPNNLKATGLKATLPRLKILDIFQKYVNKHLSAEDVYRLLIQDKVDVGLATVYRVLMQFEQAGILSRHHFEQGRAVYELANEQHHDHLVCVSCGTVAEFSDGDIEKRQKKIALDNGFEMIDHTMVIYGRCGNCMKKDAI